MVAQSHAYRFCCLGESCGNDAVELGWRWVPADMVVDGDNVSSIVEHPETHDVPWVGSVLRNFPPANSDSIHLSR